MALSGDWERSEICVFNALSFHEDPEDCSSIQILPQINVCLSQLIPEQVCRDPPPRTFSHKGLSITDTPATDVNDCHHMSKVICV